MGQKPFWSLIKARTNSASTTGRTHLQKLFSLIVLLMLFSCSNQAMNKPHSDNITPGNPTSADPATKQKAELAKMYEQAIGDYIRLVRKEYKISFDTLYFGKRQFGQEDDFPDINLPAIIENTHIQLISPELGKQKQEANKSSFYINLIGWVESEKANFIFVAFSNGMAHQFDGYLDYQYDAGKQGFVLVNTRFENFLYKAKG